MKKKELIMAPAILAMAMGTAYADDITVTVNGINVEFDQTPVIDNDRTLVPMRAIFEAIGATVEWNDETKTVTSKKEDTVITLAIGSAEMKVDDETVVLDVPAKIINSRTMVPVRAISEAMDCKVDWVADTRTVVITTEISTAQPEETTAPEATQQPIEAVSVDIKDDVNIYDPAWLSDDSEIDIATGEVKKNANALATDYIAINANKSYYAGYYDTNACEFKAGICVKYAFYDADKKFISGANTDMAKLVKAPENAAYIRYTVNLKETGVRSNNYLVFMQTETVPTEFARSEAVLNKADTELFAGKKIALVGDQQAVNAMPWTNIADGRLGARVLSVKGFSVLPFTSYNGNSLSVEKTLATLPEDADYMIVSAGFWDWSNSWNIGDEISNSGGIYEFLDTAKIRWPNTKIIMMTLPCAKCAKDDFTEGGVYNKLGLNTMDYSNQIIEACEKTSTEYIDISQLWDYSNIAQYMKEESLSYQYPNEEGGKLIADAVVEKMIEIAQK